MWKFLEIYWNIWQLIQKALYGDKNGQRFLLLKLWAKLFAVYVILAVRNIESNSIVFSFNFENAVLYTWCYNPELIILVRLWTVHLKCNVSWAHKLPQNIKNKSTIKKHTSVCVCTLLSRAYVLMIHCTSNEQSTALLRLWILGCRCE